MTLFLPESLLNFQLFLYLFNDPCTDRFETLLRKMYCHAKSSYSLYFTYDDVTSGLEVTQNIMILTQEFITEYFMNFFH